MFLLQEKGSSTLWESPDGEKQSSYRNILGSVLNSLGPLWQQHTSLCARSVGISSGGTAEWIYTHSQEIKRETHNSSVILILMTDTFSC